MRNPEFTNQSLSAITSFIHGKDAYFPSPSTLKGPCPRELNEAANTTIRWAMLTFGCEATTLYGQFDGQDFTSTQEGYKEVYPVALSLGQQMLREIAASTDLFDNTTRPASITLRRDRDTLLSPLRAFANGIHVDVRKDIVAPALAVGFSSSRTPTEVLVGQVHGTGINLCPFENEGPDAYLDRLAPVMTKLEADQSGLRIEKAPLSSLMINPHRRADSKNDRALETFHLAKRRVTLRAMVHMTEPERQAFMQGVV